MTTVALRTALIWHDEVMDDVVVHKPTNITIGHKGKPTFTIPALGLPENFAIVRPGNRGYLLTLGDKMRGTICIDGQQKDVEEFVRRGGEGEGPGGFRATPISGKDWGVIDLDASGIYKLFFQFVPVEDHQPYFSKPVLLAGLGGYVLSTLILTAIFFLKGVTSDFEVLGSGTLGDILECGFRAWGLASITLTLAALAAWLFRQDNDQQASFGFSVVLHAALLFMTYQLYDGTDPFAYPGPRALTGQYLATRLADEPEPPKQEPTVASNTKSDGGAAAAKTPEKPKNTATKTAEGAAGGKGETERARDPNATNDRVNAPPPEVALMTRKSQKIITEVIDRSFSTDLDKFNVMKGDTPRAGSLGFGDAQGGTGVGGGKGGTGTTRGSKGTGTGGGGDAEGDYESKKGKIDTGPNRPGGGNCAKPPCGHSPKEIKVTLSDPEGDFGGLTAEEINRVVKARAGIFRACYQTELNRSPGIGGKLNIAFQIGGDGVVKSSKVAPGSSLKNDAVESCVKSNIMRLKFPAKGGIANVNYPFLFQPGG